ncbi:helix-turn-helix domain-containing protein [Specibacter cremeus]|uniref:helix-turn-helix domain-containing protein n=1 Tax=Specibacter cremeus TaxID=1629051 RepID=UPI000F78D999|nr:XRE family transcriptional regulator [Specibacter cremeus]
MNTSVDRVREVIASTGLSQSDFAEAVGLDAPKMSKSLGGARRFSSLDFARIAEVGHVTVDWLLSGVEPAFATAARRTTGSGGEAAMAEARRIVDLRSVAGDLGYPQEPGPPLGVSLGHSPRTDGEALAGAALHVTGEELHDGDLVDLIERHFGIDVGIADLGEGFDGLSVVTPDARAILVSPTALAARQRFTLAHELGHVLAEDDQGVHLDQDIYSTSLRKDPTEVRANAFAAAFLMPAALLTARVTPGFDESHFCNLVLDCQVSPSALAIRLGTLCLIDSIAADSFKAMTYAQAAHRTHRAADVARSSAKSSVLRPPAALARDLFAAYSDGETTLRPYATLLGVDPAELRAGLEATAEAM